MERPLVKKGVQCLVVGSVPGSSRAVERQSGICWHTAGGGKDMREFSAKYKTTTTSHIKRIKHWYKPPQFCLSYAMLFFILHIHFIQLAVRLKGQNTWLVDIGMSQSLITTNKCNHVSNCFLQYGIKLHCTLSSGHRDIGARIVTDICELIPIPIIARPFSIPCHCSWVLTMLSFSGGFYNVLGTYNAPWEIGTGVIEQVSCRAQLMIHSWH